jgi:hypothetical protein
MDALEGRTQKVAVLVLGAGIVRSMNRQRAKKALEYTTNDSNIPIIVSGGKGGIFGSYMVRTEAEQMADYLPHTPNVILETQALNTLQNIAYSKPIIDSLGAKKVVLVTSKAHMSRAVAYAKERLPECEIKPLPTSPKWYDLSGRLLELGCFIYEHTKIPIENAFKGKTG